MKKTILFLSAIISVILMSSIAYAESGNAFYKYMMNKDGTIYYAEDGEGDIKLPDEANNFYAADDYIYYTAYSSNSYDTADLYRCSIDFSQKTHLTSCSPYNVFYYNNSIYYTVPVYEGEVLYSMDTDTLEVKKHLTYTGELDIYSIEKDYIYFGVTDSDYTTTKLYKMSIHDRTDKKLLYLTQTEYIYECFAAGDKVYIDTFRSIKIMDDRTGQILNTIDYDDIDLYILGQVDGTVYLCDIIGKIYYIDSNNDLQFVAEGTYIEDRGVIMGENISNNRIYLYMSDYANNTYKIYEYNIISNTFTEIN